MLLMIVTINVIFPVLKELIYEFKCKRIGIDVKYLQSNVIMSFLWLSCDSPLENSLPQYLEDY